MSECVCESEQASCARYKPNWFPDARWRYALATKLGSGGETQEVLVYGGLGTQTYSGLNSYQLSTQTWRSVPVKHHLELPKLQGCRMVIVPTGHGALSGWIVLFGGAGEKAGHFSNQIWGISPGDTPTLHSLVTPGTAPLPAPRREHSMFIYKGVVFVVGGQAEDGKLLKDVWKFDLAAKCWRETMWKAPDRFDPLGYGLAQHQSSVLPRGLSDGALVFGGLDSNSAANNDLWLLKSEGVWAKCKLIQPLGTKPAPRYAHCQTTLEESGLMAVYGGFSQDQKLVFRDLHIFIMETLTWSRIRLADEALLPALAGGGLASSGNDVYLFGGLGSTGYRPFWTYKFSLSREPPHLRPAATTEICKRFIQNLKSAVAESKGGSVVPKRGKGILELIMEHRGGAIRKDGLAGRPKRKVHIQHEAQPQTYFEYN